MPKIEAYLFASLFFVVLLLGFSACERGAPPPAKGKVISFGVTEVDNQIGADFSSIADAPVTLDSKKIIPLSEFLQMIKTQLDCPKGCDGFSTCEKDKSSPEVENCSIQWSKKIHQSPNQDLEPGSIWTLEYRRKQSRVDVKSLFAFWKDL